MRSLLVTLLAATAWASSDFHRHCSQSLETGRAAVDGMAHAIHAYEMARRETAMQRAIHTIRTTKLPAGYTLNLSSQWDAKNETCPKPDPDIYSTPSTAATTTAGTTTEGATTEGATTTTAGDATTQTHTTTTAAPPKRKPIPAMFYANVESDPYAVLLNGIHHYLSQESHVCNSKITDLNSLTEEQLYGFFSTLAASHPGPFCSLCHRLTDEAWRKIFITNELVHSKEEQMLLELVFSFVPTARSVCTTLAPGCHENYEQKARNITEAVVCLECTACMSALNALQHKFLLDKKLVQSVLDWLRATIFHNVCAEICIALQHVSPPDPLFPNGFSYDGCIDFTTNAFNTVIRIAKTVLRPERFCALETKWCQLNEQPNILHCGRELCVEGLGDTPQTRWLCGLIPDEPKNADAFLNVHETKVYKTIQPHHVSFAQSRDEL